MRDDEFQDKVALITGAGTGIGRAIAIECARRASTFIVTDRDGVSAEGVQSEIEAMGVPPSPSRSMSNDPGEIKKGMAKAVETVGGIDALLNVAGTNLAKTVEETEDEEWQRIIDVNLTSVYRCSKHALPELRKRKGGIVNVSSIAGLIGEGRCAAYSAS